MADVVLCFRIRPTIALSDFQTNLVVTAGMLSPNNGQVMTAFWQIANQYVNVHLPPLMNAVI
jgi:hypothetical protein